MMQDLPRLFAVMAACALAIAATGGVATAHIYTYHAGGGPDTVIGHSHIDQLNGGAGCDTVAGRDNADVVNGGASGCDVVRGQAGSFDDVITWGDFGRDSAYGGAGYEDWCFVENIDYWGPSCELVTVSYIS